MTKTNINTSNINNTTKINKNNNKNSNNKYFTKTVTRIKNWSGYNAGMVDRGNF